MLLIVLICKVPGFWVVSIKDLTLFLDYFKQIKQGLKPLSANYLKSTSHA